MIDGIAAKLQLEMEKPFVVKDRKWQTGPRIFNVAAVDTRNDEGPTSGLGKVGTNVRAFRFREPDVENENKRILTVSLPKRSYSATSTNTNTRGAYLASTVISRSWR